MLVDFCHVVMISDFSKILKNFHIPALNPTQSYKSVIYESSKPFCTGALLKVTRWKKQELLLQRSLVQIKILVVRAFHSTQQGYATRTLKFCCRREPAGEREVIKKPSALRRKVSRARNERERERAFRPHLAAVGPKSATAGTNIHVSHRRWPNLQCKWWRGGGRVILRRAPPPSLRCSISLFWNKLKIKERTMQRRQRVCHASSQSSPRPSRIWSLSTMEPRHVVQNDKLRAR